MATEPRRSADPDDTLSEVKANFEKLANTLDQAIQRLENEARQQDALSHLRSAHAAAIRGASLTHSAKQRMA
jgi:hypothetical protein